jgi:hypothetical protein
LRQQQQRSRLYNIEQGKKQNKKKTKKKEKKRKKKIDNSNDDAHFEIMKTIKQMRWKEEEEEEEESLAHYEQQESRCRGERRRERERERERRREEWGARRPGGGGLELGFLSVDWSENLSSNKIAPRGESEAFNDPTPTVAYNDRVRTILGSEEGVWTINY